MRTKILLLILPFLIVFCKQTEEKSYVKEDNGVFKIIDVKESYFEFVGNNLQYHFEGNIQNTSENIYDKVYTSVEIHLELDNGNIITENDYSGDNIFMGAFGESKKILETKRSKDYRSINTFGSNF